MYQLATRLGYQLPGRYTVCWLKLNVIAYRTLVQMELLSRFLIIVFCFVVHKDHAGYMAPPGRYDAAVWKVASGKMRM